MKKLITIISTILYSYACLFSQKPVFDHIAIYVNNLEKSAAFYKNIIGIDSIPNPFNDHKHVWFDIGAKNALHIIAGAKSALKHPQNNHICFSISSVDAFAQNLLKAGISYENANGKENTITIRPDGVKQIYFKDPDGYWIEINDAKEL